MADQQSPQAWYLKSSVPVFFPAHPALFLKQDEFSAFLQKDIASRYVQHVGQDEEDELSKSLKSELPIRAVAATVDGTSTEDWTVIHTPPSTIAVPEKVESGGSEDETTSAAVEAGGEQTDTAAEGSNEKSPFIEGLLSTIPHKRKAEEVPDLTGKMLTENGDVALRSTRDVLVDLFFELEEVITAPRLMELLNAAWAHDNLATLKIIFNARSIHLGKSSRSVFYRAAGWLFQNHPHTLAVNLEWLSRPVIEKTAEKVTKETPETAAKEADSADTTDEQLNSDVRFGVAHGYWKDLLNLLALAVNGKLDGKSSPRDVLNVHQRNFKIKSRDKDAAKVLRRQTREQRHARAVQQFQEEAAYRALHLCVARLFAEQLQRDLAALRGTDAAAKKCISLCAKWAPSTDCFHDRHTFVVSSVAEILHPASEFPGTEKNGGNVDDNDANAARALYLRHAREAYRKDVAALRAHLQVVERNISAGTFTSIDYERVPSLAMKAYTPLFWRKDEDHFEAYLSQVVSGRARISGATLLPSTLVHSIWRGDEKDIRVRVANAQWKTLLQRVKDSGTLENSLAICDVSGSMTSPTLPDGTQPLHSSIGLSLLVAQAAAPPFAGCFITFSESPEVVQVDVAADLFTSVHKIGSSYSGYSTDFVAAFEKLILPMAQRHQLKQEDMVKRIFVFSDMQFNEADSNISMESSRWTSSYERIEKLYADAGYEMPEMVFWNLAGGHDDSLINHSHVGEGDPTAPKPADSDVPGTVLVSGYSQAMLKVFLSDGVFSDPNESNESGKDGAEKKKLDGSDLVKKAISHKAYDMLKVVD